MRLRKRRYDQRVLSLRCGPIPVSEATGLVNSLQLHGLQALKYALGISGLSTNPEEKAVSLMETDRLQLRAVTTDDYALMLAVWNDPAFIRNVADRGIRTEQEARDAIAAGASKLFEEYGYGPYSMSLKTDGTMIGICGLFRRDNLDDPDIGFAVLPDYCGKGYAGEAAQAVVSYARDTVGLEVLTAIVSPTNAPSIGLIEKLGLTFERMITMPGDTEAISLYSMTLQD